MLQIIGFTAFLPEVIETDLYVPINVVWGDPSNSGDNLIYWRSGDISRSLIEIGLDTRGAIRTLTLVMVPQIVSNCVSTIEPVEQQIGLPICNIDKWESKTYYDDPHSFYVTVSESHLSVTFENSNRIKSVLVSGQTRFSMDSDGFLCRIDVTGLSKNQMSIITEQ